MCNTLKGFFPFAALLSRRQMKRTAVYRLSERTVRRVNWEGCQLANGVSSLTCAYNCARCPRDRYQNKPIDHSTCFKISFYCLWRNSLFIVNTKGERRFWLRLMISNIAKTDSITSLLAAVRFLERPKQSVIVRATTFSYKKWICKLFRHSPWPMLLSFSWRRRP